MVQRFEIGVRLGLGFGLVLVLTATLAVLGITRMAAIKKDFNTIVKSNNVKISMANASASEQMSATAEELSSQSEQLQETIGFFNIGERKTVRGPARQAHATAIAAAKPAPNKSAKGKASRLSHAGSAGAALQMQAADEEFESF